MPFDSDPICYSDRPRSVYQFSIGTLYQITSGSDNDGIIVEGGGVCGGFGVFLQRQRLNSPACAAFRAGPVE